MVNVNFLYYTKNNLHIFVIKETVNVARLK